VEAHRSQIFTLRMYQNTEPAESHPPQNPEFTVRNFPNLAVTANNSAAKAEQT